MAERQHDEHLAEVRALLPGYVSGTLDADAAARVDEALSRSRALAAEVAWLRRLRDLAVDPRDASGGGRLPLPVADVGPGDARRGTRASLPRIRRRWGRGAVAIAAVAIAVQGVFLAGLAQREPARRTEPPAAGSAGDLLTITFVDGASAADIRSVLTSAGARIVDGPGTDGTFTVRVPAGEEARSRETLARERSVIRRAERVASAREPAPERVSAP